MRVIVATLCALWLAPGCATHALPYCEKVPIDPVAPSTACLEDPEVQRVSDHLRAEILPLADHSRVRVFFDREARVQEVCVNRAATDATGWQDRSQLGRVRKDIEATPLAPSCLADRSLDLNRIGEVHAEIEQIQRDCQRNSLDGRGRAYLNCLDRHQHRRGEIWVFDFQDGPARVQSIVERPSSDPLLTNVFPTNREPLVFESNDPDNRLDAIYECATRNPGRPTREAPIAYAYHDTRVVDCMARMGWRWIEVR